MCVPGSTQKAIRRGSSAMQTHKHSGSEGEPRRHAVNEPAGMHLGRCVPLLLFHRPSFTLTSVNVVLWNTDTHLPSPTPTPAPSWDTNVGFPWVPLSSLQD